MPKRRRTQVTPGTVKTPNARLIRAPEPEESPKRGRLGSGRVVNRGKVGGRKIARSGIRQPPELGSARIAARTTGQRAGGGRGRAKPLVARRAGSATAKAAKHKAAPGSGSTAKRKQQRPRLR